MGTALRTTRPLALPAGDAVYERGAAVRIDAASGEVRWETPGPVGLGPVAVTDDALVYAGIGPTGAGAVGAFDLRTGAESWSRPFDASLGLGVAAADGVVVAVDRTGVVRARDEATGRALWSRTLETPAFAAPAILGDTVLVAAGGRDEDAIDRTYQVLAYRLADGAFAGSLEMAGSSFAFTGNAGITQGAYEVAGLWKGLPSFTLLRPEHRAAT
jgi:outer membrane protein assembly factor BamB